MGFPFCATLIDWCSGFQQVAPLTTIHSLYSDISDFLTTSLRRKEWIKEYIWKLKTDVIGLKKAMIEIFHETQDKSVLTFHYSTLDHFL